MRRWAWGVEHFPWLIKHFYGEKGNKKISKVKKFKIVFNHLEGMYSWATAPIITYIVGHVPLWVANINDTKMTLFQNAPHVLSLLMQLSMVGLIVIAIMYFFMLPPLPKLFNRWNYAIIILQWLVVPFTLILFGSIPAIDSQTRLMLGGKFRLGFWVTEKKKL